MHILVACLANTGMILGLPPANKRRRYKVTPSLIGWAQTQNQLFYIWVKEAQYVTESEQKYHCVQALGAG